MREFKDTVLVIGGAGYIGSRLAEELINNKFNVIVLDKFIFNQKPIFHPRIEIWKADARDITSDLLKGIYGIIYLASTAMPDYLRNLPYSVYTEQLEGVIRVIKEAKRANVSRFTFASTTSTYGYIAREIPVNENELYLSQPDERYGETKVLIESYILSERGENFFPVILRQGTVYGWSNRMRFDLIVNRMVLDSLEKDMIVINGTGRLYRPQIYIGDVAKAHILSLLSSPRLSGQVFNISYGNYSVEDIAKLVNMVTKAKIVYNQTEEVDKRSYKVDSTKMRKLLFIPETDVRKGAIEVLENIRKSKGIDYYNKEYWNSKFLPEYYNS